MTISENTPDRLIINHHPWFWQTILSVFVLIGAAMIFHGFRDNGNVLLGAFFFCAGGAMLWETRPVCVILDRTMDSVEIRTQGLLDNQSEFARLSDVLEVVEESRPGGDSETHRLALVLQDESSMAFTKSSYSGGGHPALRAEINAWLAKK